MNNKMIIIIQILIKTRIISIITITNRMTNKNNRKCTVIC